MGRHRWVSLRLGGRGFRNWLLSWRVIRRELMVWWRLRRLLYVLLRGGLWGGLLEMLGLLVMLAMLGREIVHILLLIVV